VLHTVLHAAPLLPEGRAPRAGRKSTPRRGGRSDHRPNRLRGLGAGGSEGDLQLGFDSIVDLPRLVQTTLPVLVHFILRGVGVSIDEARIVRAANGHMSQPTYVAFFPSTVAERLARAAERRHFSRERFARPRHLRMTE
jgi:hypothetical protein